MQSWRAQGRNPEILFCRWIFYKMQVNSTEMVVMGKGVMKKCWWWKCDGDQRWRLQENRIKVYFKSKNKTKDYLEPKSPTWWSSSFGMAGVVVTDHVLECARRASFTTSVCWKRRKFIFSTVIMTPLTTFSKCVSMFCPSSLLCLTPLFFSFRFYIESISYLKDNATIELFFLNAKSCIYKVRT